MVGICTIMHDNTKLFESNLPDAVCSVNRPCASMDCDPGWEDRLSNVPSAAGDAENGRDAPPEEDRTC